MLTMLKMSQFDLNPFLKIRFDAEIVRPAVLISKKLFEEKIGYKKFI